jgi:hypothetical protein
MGYIRLDDFVKKLVTPPRRVFDLSHVTSTALRFISSVASEDLLKKIVMLSEAPQ